MDPMTAADVAEAFLAAQGSRCVVDRDPFEILHDDEVFVFSRVPAPVDNQLLVVDKATGLARFVAAHPWEPDPFPNLLPLQDES